MLAGTMKPERLKCESLISPLGVEVLQPRLSWILQSDSNGKSQSAYRILVSENLQELAKNQGGYWDSGKVESQQTAYVKYAGKSLQSGRRYYWKVMVWDEGDRASPYSDIAEWGMGLLDRMDWQGSWIGTGLEDIPLFRRVFKISKPVQYATLHVCGLYLHEVCLNGRKVGDHRLDPPVTSYWKRVMYVSHDITGFLRSGDNAVGVWLAAWRTKNYKSHDLLLQMEIRYTDGTGETIVSDETWRWSRSPVVHADEYDGETYDARMEQTGWDEPGFDDSFWKQAVRTQGPKGKLAAMDVEPRKVTETFHPVSRSEPKPGVFVFDLGQNIAGWIRLKVRGMAGERVVLRFAELLYSNGMINQTNLRAAKATDTYILKGEVDGEEWEPRFTFHGFRYVEVTGYPGMPECEDVLAKVVHTAFTPSGRFFCSNGLLNQLYENVRWGHRGLHQSIRVDCPQRDERKGWLGDVAIDSEGAAYNFDACAFYRKWLEDVRLVQREDGSLPDMAPDPPFFSHNDIVWSSAYLIILNWYYDMYADVDVLRKHYPHAKRWVECIRDTLLRPDDTVDYNAYGDWCSPVEDEGVQVKSIKFTNNPYDAFPPTTAALYPSAYYCKLVEFMRRFAEILGEEEDRQYFQAFYEKLRAAFNRRFLSEEQDCYDNGSNVSYIVPLAFGLVPPDKEEAFISRLADDIMNVYGGKPHVGLIGMQWLFQMLDRSGRPDIAYEVATQTEYPSLGYMVKNGATTIWELWNGNTNEGEMNSHNHLMMNGDLISWFYKDLGGIRPDSGAPGFQRAIIRPRPVGDLHFVHAEYESIHGNWISSWSVNCGTFQLSVTIPVNCTAHVHVPALRRIEVDHNGDPNIRFLRMADGCAVFEVRSGSYVFRNSRYA